MVLRDILVMRDQFLSDETWALIEPHLPKRQPMRGRPWQDDRRTLEGILWVLRTGARWKDLPERYPSPATCWRRLQQWERQGLWLKIWRTFLKRLDARGALEWSEVLMDGSFAPAKKGGSASAKPRREKERSGWWWSTARVFLWEANCAAPRRRK
jgi:transposase